MSMYKSNPHYILSIHAYLYKQCLKPALHVVDPITTLTAVNTVVITQSKVAHDEQYVVVITT